MVFLWFSYGQPTQLSKLSRKPETPRRQRDQREDRGAALSQQRSHDGAASVLRLGKSKKRRQP